MVHETFLQQNYSMTYCFFLPFWKSTVWKRSGEGNFTVEKSDRHYLRQVVKVNVKSGMSALSGPHFQDDEEKKEQQLCQKRAMAMCSLFTAPTSPNACPKTPLRSLINTVEAAAIGDISEVSVFDSYVLPHLYLHQNYITAWVVPVRAR